MNIYLRTGIIVLVIVLLLHWFIKRNPAKVAAIKAVFYPKIADNQRETAAKPEGEKLGSPGPLLPQDEDLHPVDALPIDDDLSISEMGQMLNARHITPNAIKVPFNEDYGYTEA